MTRKLLISADDFGLSIEVNEAIEIAHRQGILSTANLMIAGDAAKDAIKRAKKMPGLRVGLHVVVIEGKSVLDKTEIPSLVNQDGIFPSKQLEMGIDYFFSKSTQRQLDREIRAQFQAFKNTGLPLDHVDVHKHMHFHPTIANLILNISKEYQLKYIRLPREPYQILQQIAQVPRYKNLNSLLLFYWTYLLERQIRQAGMHYMDWCFGLSWCGHMTFDRIQKLLPLLPPGTSEMFFHPAISPTGLYHQLMPYYKPVEELETLCNPDFPKLLQAYGIKPVIWNDI